MLLQQHAAGASLVFRKINASWAAHAVGIVYCQPTAKGFQKWNWNYSRPQIWK